MGAENLIGKKFFAYTKIFDLILAVENPFKYEKDEILRKLNKYRMKEFHGSILRIIKKIFNLKRKK